MDTPSRRPAFGISPFAPDFMTHLRITSPAIEAIDKKIAALKAERKLKVSEAVGAKVQALCAEAAAKKARK